MNYLEAIFSNNFLISNNIYFTMFYVKCTFWHLRWNHCLLTIFESFFPLATKLGATKFRETRTIIIHLPQKKREISNHNSHVFDKNFVKQTILLVSYWGAARWFHEIFFGEREFLSFPMFCAHSYFKFFSWNHFTLQ